MARDPSCLRDLNKTSIKERIYKEKRKLSKILETKNTMHKDKLFKKFRMM